MPPDVPAFFREHALPVKSVELPVEAFEPERQPWVLDAHCREAQRRLEQARINLEKAGKATAPTAAPTAPDPAGVPSELELARLAVREAESGLRSVQCRSEALRAGWSGGGGTGAEAVRMAALRAERRWDVDRAGHALALQRAAVHKAPPGKKAEAEKKLKAAEADLRKAETAAGREPEGKESFRPLPGAKWSATRFMNSGKDDPEVAFPKTSSGRRKAFAEWVTDPRNPLTARVAVNHLWGRHFGFYLAGTPFDLGRSGTPPTHPEVVDWLASELVEKGWSLRQLHRVLVTSAVYRMSSSRAGCETELAADPDNRRIWRRLPLRLEGEAIRDSLLALSGILDETRGGPSVDPAVQAASRRRSVYFFHSNNDRDLFLTTFDGAMVRECYRREQSVLPQQALAMLNGSLAEEAAGRIAARVTELLPPGAGDAEFVRRSFLMVTGSHPSPAGVEASLGALERWRAPGTGDGGRAREYLVWVLLNHHDFVTLK